MSDELPTPTRLGTTKDPFLGIGRNMAVRVPSGLEGVVIGRDGGAREKAPPKAKVRLQSGAVEWHYCDHLTPIPTADDVRWLAQRVVAKAFHGVSDASVEALARRVLELEANGETLRAVDEAARKSEREACAVAAGDFAAALNNQAQGAAPTDAVGLRAQARVAARIAESIMARGGK